MDALGTLEIPAGVEIFIKLIKWEEKNG